MAVFHDQKDQVQQATDLVSLVSEHVALRPRGNEFVGLCPFHDDRNPSLTVAPRKQIFHCFVCSTGGDVFGWMMKYHKMSFPEALRYLAERAGIKLEQQRGPNAQATDSTLDSQLIAQANEQALSFYSGLLSHRKHGLKARQYIEQRRISPEMIEQFGIGYAADLWDGLVQMIQTKGWNGRAFEMAGLISTRPTSNGFYDRFRHRLIFPICDALGRPIAFGGRVLPDSSRDDRSDAKYLNSPETPLFNKSATLYGLHLAKKAIMAQHGCAVIVEGYTDVIACHQAGCGNAVATLGTALTVQHVKMLRRFAQKAVLIFDADKAGQGAADRAAELSLLSELDVAIAILPDGLDPDSLLKSDGGLEKWNRIVDSAVDVLAYQFNRTQQQFNASQTVTGAQQALDHFVQMIGRMGLAQVGPTRRKALIKQLSQLVGTSDHELDRLLRTAARPPRPVPGSTPAPKTTLTADNGPENDNSQLDFPEENGGPTITNPMRHAQLQLIGALLRRPDAFNVQLRDGRSLEKAISSKHMLSPDVAALYQYMHDSFSKDAVIDLARLSGDLTAEGQVALSELAISAEAEIQRREASSEPNQLARDAAESLLVHLKDQDYEARKAQLLHESTTKNQDAKLEALVQAREHHRLNPSSRRIARIRS